jgi:hypothetical protein
MSMAFFKTASAKIVATYQSSGKFTKIAAQNDEVSEAQDIAVKKVLNFLSKDTLKAIAKVYNLSDDINSYIFPVPRAVTSQTPNNNGDRFSHEELTRFSSAHRCMVYQTFRNDPLHIEHVASDPKAARGYIPDVHYVTADPKDMYVLTVVALDASKDPPLAEGIMNGEVDSFSMGCICESVKCSYCNKTANSDRELCDHLRWYKMSKLDGKLVYEDCLGVEYQELSVVGTPADPKAQTQAILNHIAKNKNALSAQASFNLISSLVTQSDQFEIARFFHENVGKLPESLVRLADKLF